MKPEESDQTKIAVLVEKVGNMNVVLTKLDTKFDSFNDKFAKVERVDILDKKVDNLEGWKYKAIGAASTIALAVSWAKDWVMGHTR